MSGIDRSALAWGAVFCTIGIAFLLDALDVWEVRIAVVGPLLLIVAGAVLALSAALPDRSERS